MKEYKFDMKEFFKFEGLLMGREIPYVKTDEEDEHHLRFAHSGSEWDVAISPFTYGSDDGCIEGYSFVTEDVSCGCTASECWEWIQDHLSCVYAEMMGRACGIESML